MKRSLVGGVGIAAALVMVFGSGTAGADLQDLVGLPYGKAEASINSWAKAVVASREGSYLPTEDCIVAGVRRSSSHQGGTTILVDLNCNDLYAGKTGHPGNSAASEAGKNVQKMKASGVRMSEGYAKAVAAGKGAEFWCRSTENYLNWCRKVCDEGGTCSDELVQYLS